MNTYTAGTIITGGTLALGAAASAVPVQPLSHYTFGGVSQGTFTGSFQDTGTANNPLFTTGGNGSPTVIPGPLGGQAVQFPGNLQANYIPAYGALTSYTVSNWVNLANGDGGAWQTRGGDNNFGVTHITGRGNDGEIHNEIYTTGSSWCSPISRIRARS